MTKHIDDGGPAFPRTANDADRNADIYSEIGMSLRDYFAGQALAGLLSCSTTSGNARLFATEAYEFADAMIARRAAPVAQEATE